MRIQVLILFTTISLTQCDSSCTERPPDSVTVSVTVTKEQTRGSFIALKPSNQTNPTSEANMVSGVSEQCPNNCIFRMKTYVANHGGSLLHVRDPYPALIPLGYNAMSQDQNLYCARESGFCGATVPLYRHYRLDSSGIHHAYSFNTSSISSYVREPFPLCYVWPTIAAREPRASTEQSCASKDKIESKHLIPLNEYKSDQIAIFIDRYLTTRSSSDPSLAKYTLDKPYGKVLPNNHQSTCDCLIKLKQQVETSAPLNRLNHRISPLSQQNSFYENYSDEGETFFCAKTAGACGASVPLYRYFNLMHMNYIYSMTSSPIIFSIPSPADPLCFIWPDSYNMNSTTTSPTPSNMTNATTRILSTTTTSSLSQSKNVTAQRPSSTPLADSALNTTSTAASIISSQNNVTTSKPQSNPLDSKKNSNSTIPSTTLIPNNTSAVNTSSSTVKSVTNTSLATSTTSTITSLSSKTTSKASTSVTRLVAFQTTSSTRTSSPPSTILNVTASSSPVTTTTSTLRPSNNTTLVVASNSTSTMKPTEMPSQPMSIQKRQPSERLVANDNPSPVNEVQFPEEHSKTHEYGPAYAVVVIRTANQTSNN